MTLTEEVFAEMQRRSNNPQFVQMSGETEALCAVLQRKMDTAVKYLRDLQSSHQAEMQRLTQTDWHWSDGC